jgi:RimJ/RimL family protein N-acetyltransferase
MNVRIDLPPMLGDGVVRLDAFTLDDAEAHWLGEDAEMRRRFDDPEPHTPKPLEQARASMARWIDYRAAGGPQLAYAVRVADGVLAGGCELQRPEVARAHVSWWVFPAYRGRGLAGRAARLLCRAALESMAEVRRIEAHIDFDNHPSRGVVLGAGFVEDGEIVEGTWAGAVVTRLRYVLVAGI